MKLQRLLSLTRQALDAYDMIDPGDKIAVGLSGGKDSLALLYAMKHLQKFYPKSFDLCAVTVDLGFGNFDLQAAKIFCQKLSVPYTVVPTEISQIVFESRQESNPCALCAKMRKGALNKAAKDLGCNKIAYAHHRDDVIDTMMLSLIYEGRFHTFSPKTYLDRMDLFVIRPFLYVSEADIIGFKNRYQLPVCKNPCPVDGKTKREFVKNLIKSINTEAPGVKDRFFHAVASGNIPGLTVNENNNRK
ncbi:MAG: ATP-binding protein [Clostridium sp.]